MNTRVEGDLALPSPQRHINVVPIQTTPGLNILPMKALEPVGLPETNAMRVQTQLIISIGEVIQVQPYGDMYRISTPFAFPDGDSFVIRMRLVGDRYELTDIGHTMMHLSFGGDVELGFFLGLRKHLFERVLSRFQIENRDGELVLPVKSEQELGAAVLSFSQALTHISDILSGWACG